MTPERRSGAEARGIVRAVEAGLGRPSGGVAGARALSWARRLALVAALAAALVGCKRRFALGTAEGEASARPPVALPPGAVPVATGAPPPPLPASTSTLSPPPGFIPSSFASLAKAANPAVVTIKTRQEIVFRSGRRRVVGEGLGTGFVYDADGFLLTNNHVIEGASDISVTFADGRETPARVVGRDKLTDVAVVKVAEKGLPVLPLGDSDALEVGDWVVAIGNPFGLAHTVSAGILSAKGRTRDDVRDLGENGYFNFLQTDAAINQGNSGGPLIDLRGQVVGINSAIRANANNIGFAIPIGMVRQLLPILVRDGKVTRSALGVVVGGVTQEIAQRLGRADRRGVWVKGVSPGGGADRAGLAADDVILVFDGKPVADENELRWHASLAGVGRSVSVRVARGDRVFDVKVTLGLLAPADDEDDEPTGH